MKLYGLVGKKLQHSFSKAYFSIKFQHEQIAASYENFELNHASELPDLIDRYPGIRGLNVTLPYKTEVIPLLDELSETAKAIGAVNTIKVHNRKLIGYNTDVIGFKDSLQGFLPANYSGKSFILGTGGASRAVAYVLHRFYPDSEVIFVSRSPADKNAIHYQDLPGFDYREPLLFVNTTPLGMYPKVEQMPLIPYQKLNSRHFLYDLIYNPATTLFLQRGKEMGCQVKNGEEMLYAQAEASWKIWQQENLI